jgi:DNA-directed RNA polymerase specialized sigma24 family protein
VWKQIDHRPAPLQPDVDWKEVVERIREGDPAGQEMLYSNLAAGARLFLRRRLGSQDLDDRVHDVFVIVVEAIQRGELRQPERLMGFVRTILYRQLNLAISRIVSTRTNALDLESAAHLTTPEPTPEDRTGVHQTVALMKHALEELGNREFEVLVRFYLREQLPEQIRTEMKLTLTQFHLLKSRAKSKLTGIIHRKMARKPFSQV